MSLDPVPIPADAPEPEHPPVVEAAPAAAEVREASSAELHPHPLAAEQLPESLRAIATPEAAAEKASEIARTPGQPWFGNRDYSKMECRLVNGIQTSEEEVKEFLVVTEKAHGVPQGHFKSHLNPMHGFVADAGRAVVILATTTHAPKVEGDLLRDIRDDILETLKKYLKKEMLLVGHSEGGASIISAIDSINKEFYEAAQDELNRNRLIDEAAAEKENPPGKWTRRWRAITRSRTEPVAEGEEKSYEAQNELKWWLKNRKRIHADTYAIGIASAIEGMEENINVYADWRDPVAVSSLALHGISTTTSDWTSRLNNYGYPQYHCLKSDLELKDFKNPVAAHHYTKLLEARGRYEIEQQEAAEKAEREPTKEEKQEAIQDTLEMIKEANGNASSENRFRKLLRSVRDVVTRPFRSRDDVDTVAKRD